MGQSQGSGEWVRVRVRVSVRVRVGLVSRLVGGWVGGWVGRRVGGSVGRLFHWFALFIAHAFAVDVESR